MSCVTYNMVAACVQFVLVVSVCIQLYGADSECNCSVSGTVMDCSYRNCRNIPTCTDDITVLKMSGNGITELTADHFENCNINIKEVHLDNNNISEIDREAFLGLEKLTYIDLSINNITTLNLDLDYNTQLMNLILAGNPLQSLTFIGKKTFKYLNLTSCQLRSGEVVVRSLEAFDKLTTLDLSFNNLTNWSEITKYVVKMKEMEFLYVSDNLWECECPRDENMMEKMMGLVVGGDPKCASPQVVAGNSLWNFSCPLPTTTTTSITTFTTTTESEITTRDTNTSTTDTVPEPQTTFPSSDSITTQPSSVESAAVIISSSDVIALACLCATSLLVLAAILVHDYLDPVSRDQWMRTLLNVHLIPRPGVRWHALCPTPGDRDVVRFQPTTVTSRRK